MQWLLTSQQWVGITTDMPPDKRVDMHACMVVLSALELLLWSGGWFSAEESARVGACGGHLHRQLAIEISS